MRASPADHHEIARRISNIRLHLRYLPKLNYDTSELDERLASLGRERRRRLVPSHWELRLRRKRCL